MEDVSPWLDWVDSQQQWMLEHTIRLAEINSGSFNAAGVDRVGEQLMQWARELFPQAQINQLAVPPFTQIARDGEPIERPLGQAVRIEQRPGAPLQLLLVAHLDTVFPVDSPFQQVHWIDANTLNGPGVTDLKGGIMLMFTALQALERSPWADNIGWQILLNPDEEIGSHSSAPLLEQAASRADLGLVFEPCLPDGQFAGDRKGSGNFTLIVRGRSAHAGREHHLGRNAIRACCDLISQIDQLNGQQPELTINPGFIEGGASINVVPDCCIARFNIRIASNEQQRWIEQQLSSLVAAADRAEGISVKLHGGFGRKPKRLTETETRLYQWVQQCGQQLGMTLNWQATGGCCDGNNLSAAGLPNIDTLGVQGGAIHSEQEYLLVDSLTERARLVSLILLQLAQSPPEWLPRREQ